MRFVTAFIKSIRNLLYRLAVIAGFTILVILYSVKLLLDWLSVPFRKSSRLFKGSATRFNRFYENISIKFDFDQDRNVSRSYLIELAFRNMQAKKSRTIVTIGGMAIGMAFIVFLVSIGYGMQDLVTSRVARLEELQQAEVLPGLSEDLSLDDKILSRLDSLPKVKTTLPLISVVGRISFQDSVSDLAVYGVTTDYLTSSAIQPIQGEIFDSHEIAYSVKNPKPEDDQKAVDKEKTDKPTTQVPQTRIETSTDETIKSDGTLPVVKLETDPGQDLDDNRKVVPIPDKALKQAVVNRAVLSIVGMSEQDAVGQKITLTFVAVGDLVDGESDRIESVPTEYTIVGVTPEEGTPVIYIPFIELKSLGITRISQIKIIADDQESLPAVRTSIEAMGYGTISVVDTVSQINSLFATFRLVLGIIGMVALSVATLGMFNTLTISLLERTREVGLMKAMGMKSEEVRQLFLTESMIMGFYGGLFGLLLGAGAGKLLSLILSSVAIARGVGFIDISVVPFSFVVTVIVLSLVVGLLTGYYPAKRATKISALNALRYE